MPSLRLTFHFTSIRSASQTLRSGPHFIAHARLFIFARYQYLRYTPPRVRVRLSLALHHCLSPWPLRPEYTAACNDAPPQRRTQVGRISRSAWQLASGWHCWRRSLWDCGSIVGQARRRGLLCAAPPPASSSQPLSSSFPYWSAIERPPLPRTLIRHKERF